jgi:hypothetical protein
VNAFAPLPKLSADAMLAEELQIHATERMIAIRIVFIRRPFS